MTSLDDIDRDILNAIQDDLPLSHRPFAEVAARIGVEEQDLLARITRRSMDALALVPGTKVFAVIKSVSIARTDVGTG